MKISNDEYSKRFSESKEFCRYKWVYMYELINEVVEFRLAKKGDEKRFTP